MKTKKCTKCGELKSLELYHKDKRGRMGRVAACKVCVSARLKKYYDENTESVKKKVRDRYSVADKEKIRESKQKYRDKTRARTSKRQSDWYKKNRDHCASLASEWRKNNADRVREYARISAHSRRVAGGSRIDADKWRMRLDFYGGKCIYCSSQDNIEIEHRIPISRGGSNLAANLVPACRSCNRKKSDKTEFEFKELLSKEN